MKCSSQTAEVVVVGGGIMGLSTAYHLAKRGLKDIILLEKDLLAKATTGLSVGGIRQQFSHPANIRLSQESLPIFEKFEDEFGIDINFRQVGYLFLARAERTWQDFLSSVEIESSHGVPVKVLRPDEIKKHWPYLNVSDIKGGTFGPKDGYADPYLAAMGFASRARSLGVRIEEKTIVTGIKVEAGSVRGVETTNGPVWAPIVVNAAGPWAGDLSRTAGIELPVKPFRRQVFITTALPALPKPVPMIIDHDVSFYFRGEGPGILMGMSDPEEPSSYNLQVDRTFLERVVEAAVHRAPLLERAGIMRGWAGLYEVTPDDNPIIGEVPDVNGFFCIAGFSGHGFQHGPAAGRVLSQLILDGRTDFDLRPFAPDRFSHIKSEGEKRIV